MGVPPFQGAVVPGVISLAIAPAFTGLPLTDLSNYLVALGCYATFAAGIHVLNNFGVWEHQLRIRLKERDNTDSLGGRGLVIPGYTKSVKTNPHGDVTTARSRSDTPRFVVCWVLPTSSIKSSTSSPPQFCKHDVLLE